MKKTYCVRQLTCIADRRDIIVSKVAMLCIVSNPHAIVFLCFSQCTLGFYNPASFYNTLVSTASLHKVRNVCSPFICSNQSELSGLSTLNVIGQLNSRRFINEFTDKLPGPSCAARSAKFRVPQTFSDRLVPKIECEVGLIAHLHKISIEQQNACRYVTHTFVHLCRRLPSDTYCAQR